MIDPRGKMRKWIARLVLTFPVVTLAYYTVSDERVATSARYVASVMVVTSILLIVSVAIVIIYTWAWTNK